MRQLRPLIAVTLGLALGLISAGTAQAAEWAIGEKTLTTLGLSKESVATSGKTFEISVPAISTTIVCTSESGSGEIIAGEGATGSASMTLKGCSVKGTEACSVKSTGQSSGTIVIGGSTKFRAIEVENNEKAFEELTVSTVIEFTGVFCTLPKEAALKGTTAAQVPLLEEEAEERPQKYSKAIVEESGVKGLTLGENPAYLIGEDNETLSGENEGEQASATSVQVNPDPVEFGGVEPKGVVLKNTGPLKLEYTDIKISAGPFTRTDSVPCKGKKFFANEMCTIAVKCDTATSTGKLEIRWDILSANDKLKGFNRRFVDLECD